MAASKNRSIVIIRREAFDPSGRVGSLYDGNRDCVLTKSKTVVQNCTLETNRKGHCSLVNGHDNQHILQLIDIDPTLRLHILLDLVPKKSSLPLIANSFQNINKYTRVLHFSYENRTEELPNDNINNREFLESTGIQTAATHVIVGVVWGLDIYVILQLPNESQIADKIDMVLEKISTKLNDDANDIEFNYKEETLLEQIQQTTVYSNIRELDSVSKLTDICRYIERNKNSTMDLPIVYIIRPITWFYPDSTDQCSKFIPFSEKLIEIVERIVFNLLKISKTLDIYMKNYSIEIQTGLYRNDDKSISNQHLKLQSRYVSQMQEISKLMISFHQDAISEFSLITAIKQQEQDTETLTKDVNDLIEKIKGLQEERKSTTKSNETSNEHDDTINLTGHRENSQQQIQKNKSHTFSQNQNVEDKPHIIRKVKFEVDNNNFQPIKEKANNTTLKVPPKKILRKTLTQENSLGSTVEIRMSDSPSSSKIKDPINIILLGETGVGKSTFINALVNYLEFSTIEKAQMSKPIAPIPVSFTMSIGHNFQERIVKYGDLNNLHNEYFNNQGQSITQHCKSYLFHLNSGVKLRIIDTPGFGDTRGIEQDNINIDNIVKYVYNLTHLHAVCFLFKPNEAQVNISFKTCLIQLFTFLGQQLLKNLVFCFTNSRGTFYTPGNTLPLLKELFGSLLIGHIPFTKYNTFCFDSESFRYLVALQNGIHFTSEDKIEYSSSWSTSVKESMRLIDYIRSNLIPFRMSDRCFSMQHAQFEIMNMILPLTEAVRNILRNKILRNSTYSNRSLEVYPQVIKGPITLCRQCYPNRTRLQNLWILEDVPHNFQNTCLSCSCAKNQHYVVDYIFKYSLLNDAMHYQLHELNEQLLQLCHIGAEFAYFLMYVVNCMTQNPFLNRLDQMIKDEENVCSDLNPSALNSLLMKALIEQKEKHQQLISKIKANSSHRRLEAIYEWIDTINNIPMVQEQLTAHKMYQEKMITAQEFQYKKL